MKCGGCGKEIIGDKRKRYCNDECYLKVWREKLNRKYAEKQQRKLIERIKRIERLEETKSETLRLERNREKLKSVRKFLIKLAKRQQFPKPYKKRTKCEACDCMENLVEHHVKYYPIEKVTLCRSCHDYLHHNILGKKRIKPRSCGS